MRHLRSILAACFIAALLATIAPQQSAKAATAFTWSMSGDTTVSQFNDVDIRASYITNGSNFYMVYSNGANQVKRWLCTTLDTCTAQPDGILDSSYGHAYGERYWIGGVVMLNGVWLAATHVEFDYHATPALSFNWFRKIGLSKSTDQGAHWSYVGDIIFSSQSPNINDYSQYLYFDAGPGDESLYADFQHGYVYLYYTVFWAQKNTGERVEATRVARAPMSGNLMPGTWQKWDNGAFSRPGIKGQDSDIFLNEDGASVFYDTFLGEYVAIGHSTFNITYITTATSLDTQNWQPLTHFTDDSTMQFYNWPIDSTTYDPFTIGATLRLYSAQNHYSNVNSKYMTITFSNGVNNNPPPTPQQYQYPYQSVPEGLPGWTRSPDQPYGSIVNPNFTLDMNIPSGWETWPYLWQTSTYGESIVSSPTYSSSAALAVNASASGQSVEQTIDVYPNTTYTLSGWLMNQYANDGPIYIGVKQYGGNEENQAITSTSYAQGSVTFTTGASNSTARIYIWKPSGNVSYADDITLTQH